MFQEVNSMKKSLLRIFSVAVCCLAISGFLLSCSGDSGPADRPPNFIIIFTDDQGYSDVGVFGATDISTPNLDRMAEEGVKFTSFYVAAPVCTPSRAGLMTGCYPKRLGMALGVLWPWHRVGLNPKELTIAEVLKERGYATACIGKWHLGRPADLLPTRQGFDAYFGIPYSNDMGPENIVSILLSFFGAGLPPIPLMRDEEVVEEGVNQNTLTKRYTEEAVSFIRENRGKPFFLYLAHNMPHAPCHASGDFANPTVDDTHRGIYASAVEEIDWSVAQILDTLENLDIDHNTLVIFTSDNGPARTLQTMLGQPTGSALPLRGWKSGTYEGGMRVPAIMRWPGRLPAGAECRELATALDILPTLAGYAGASLPGEPDHRIDGKDISALLERPESDSPHDTFYYYDANTGLLEAVRDVEGWKLHIRKSLSEVKELYYLPDDIGESDNVYSQYPDVVERLRAASEAFDREVTMNSRPMGWAGPY